MQPSLGVTWGSSCISSLVVVASFWKNDNQIIEKIAKRTHLPLHVSNSLTLTFRILILIGLIASATRVSGLTTEWFLAFSALGGAAVGLASSQTLGNFRCRSVFAVNKAIRVGDYVRAGTVEELSRDHINYTKIVNNRKHMVSIANLQICRETWPIFLWRREPKPALLCYTFGDRVWPQRLTDKIPRYSDESSNASCHLT